MKTLLPALLLLLACKGNAPTPAQETQPKPPSHVELQGPELSLNGGFEDDSAWSDAGLFWRDSDLTETTVPIKAKGGSRLAYLGGYGQLLNDTLSTEVGIPSASTTAGVGFWAWILTEETGSTALDTCVLRVLDAQDGRELGQLATLSNRDASSTWVWHSFDLRPYAEKVLRLEWKSTENASKATSFLLDDVSIRATSSLTPAIQAFTPASSFPGESPVEVLGFHLQQATALTFGGLPGLNFQRVNGARLRATPPPLARSGPVGVITPAGSTLSPTDLLLEVRAPILHACNPTRGPVGTPIVLDGLHLSGATVRLGSLDLPVDRVSDTQILTHLPPGATSGDLVVSTEGGLDRRTFTVTEGTRTQDFYIAALQFSQGTQTPLNDVPILTGRPGYLRIFPGSNQSTSLVPSLRVRLLAGGSSVELSPSSTPFALSSSPHLQDWSASYNFLIPGEWVQADFRAEIELNPDFDDLPEVDRTNNRLTWTPSRLLSAPPLRTTLVPITQGGLAARMGSAGAAPWIRRARAMFPLNEVDALIAPPWVYTGAPLSTSGGWSALLSALESKRVAEGSSRYYYGVVNVPYSSGIAGMGYVPSPASPSGRSALGWDKTGYGDGANFDDVFAHETGHNLGRPHSPCGGAGNPDPAYPHAGGSIGAWGLDVQAGRLKDPALFKDIMGYCSPNWISDHVYKGILAFRQAAPGGGREEDGLPASAGEPPALSNPETRPEEKAPIQPCLILSALGEGGGFNLRPAFHLETRPTPDTGDLLAEGIDAEGRVLFRRRVEATLLGCGPDSGQRAVTAAIPLDHVSAGTLTSLRILQNGVPVAQRERTSPAPSAFTPSPRLRRSREGLHLSWNGAQHPAAWIWDPATRKILATLEGGEAQIPDSAAQGKLLLSDGLRTQRHSLPVSED